MITSFEPLLTLRVTHSYYESPSPDFAFTLPEDAARLLGGGRMLVRALADQRLHVAFEADEGGAARVSSIGSVLRVGLRLVNSYFSNFTSLGAMPPGSIRLYRNATDPASLGGPETRTLVGSVFSHPLAGSTRPVSVSLVRGASTLRSETVVAADRSSVAFDVTGIAPGSFAVEEVHPGGVRQSTAYYLDPELLQQGVFGVVEIAIDAGFYVEAPAFELTFTAREETLKYYLVASNYTGAEFDQLSIRDSGFTDQARPEVKFTKVATAAFGADDTPPELLTQAGGKVVLFKSQSPVGRRADGRRRIELRRNGEALIENLPQPSAASGTADLVIHVSKPKRT